MAEQHRYRILVVDDEEDIRTILTALLRPHYEVVQAKHGLDALLKFPRYEPDLALIDIMMPLMDGLQLARRIRTMPGFERTPLIAVSARDTRDDMKAGYEAGTSVYITKPFEPERVLKNVAVSLEGSPPRPKKLSMAEADEQERHLEQRKLLALSRSQTEIRKLDEEPAGPPRGESDDLRKRLEGMKELRESKLVKKYAPSAAPKPAEEAPAPPPAPTDREAPLAPGELPKSPSGTPPRVLVVEDDEDLVKMVRAILENEGFEVVTARDGLVGLNKISDCQPDLFILDGMMPKLSGYQLLEMIRSASETRAKPVVFSSGKARPRDMQTAMSKGATAYLAKPYENWQLADLVRKICRAPGFEVGDKRVPIEDFHYREGVQEDRHKRTEERIGLWQTRKALNNFFDKYGDKDPFGKESGEES